MNYSKTESALMEFMAGMEKPWTRALAEDSKEAILRRVLDRVEKKK